MIAARLAEAQVALMLLTRLPAARVREPVPRFAAAAWAFPLCGAVVGVAGWATCSLAVAGGAPPGIAAVLAVGAAVLVTGGLHEDGLADFADGVGGGRDRERTLAIMRDSRIGSFGAMALILAFGLRGLGIAEVGPLLPAFVAIGAASRCSMLLAMQFMPPARSDGLGHAARRPGNGRVAAGVALTLLCLVPLGSAAWAAAAIMALAASVPAVLALRRIGGQTGDVLGAIQVTAEAAGWVVVAAAA